jgi:NADH-quinone oxidoreductase subunit M
MALLSSFQPQASLNVSLYRGFMIAGGIGTILTAGYFLWMLQRVNMGTVPEKWTRESFSDVIAIEWVSWVPLLLAVVVLGLFPRIVFSVSEGAVNSLMHLFGG